MNLDDPRVYVDEKGSLHINNARLTDSHKYVCRAENGYGEPVIESAFISVRLATKVVKGKKTQKIKNNSYLGIRPKSIAASLVYIVCTIAKGIFFT